MATNRSNHLSMQPSLAIRFTDTELPRLLHARNVPPSVPRGVVYSVLSCWLDRPFPFFLAADSRCEIRD